MDMECADPKAPIRLQFDSWELVAYNTIQDNEMRRKEPPKESTMMDSQEVEMIGTKYNIGRLCYASLPGLGPFFCEIISLYRLRDVRNGAPDKQRFGSGQD